MKKFFIVPGFKEKVTNKKYILLKKFLTTKGFEVVMVPVIWDRKTISENAKEFQEFYNKHKGKENYILGFSFGAVITFISAEKLQPKKIFLCSLSPYFKEDLKNEKQWILDYVGRKRVADFLLMRGKAIAKELKIPATIFYGEEEGRRYPKLKKRCEETASLVYKAKLVVVKNAPHDTSFPEYAEAIMNEFSY